MRADTFTLAADDGHPLFVYRWLPDEGTPVKGTVHIAHGMAEHAARYARVAEALTRAGYAVYADDHRGHGKTARTQDELGFFAEQSGWDRVVRDLAQLVEHEKKQQAGRPFALVGHSMGSYLAQQFLYEHGRAIQAAVLSGTGGKPDLLANAGRLVARAERLRLGARGKSKLLTSLSFDAFNKQFKPNRTEFDWLSRDAAEVDKYIADPLCGFAVTTSLWVDLLDALPALAKPENQAKIPKDLPIWIFCGSRDPVGANTKSVHQLIDAYRSAGIRDVTHTFYADGRHEMVNEINRDVVIGDLVDWLDTHMRA